MELKTTNILLATLIIISCTLLVWTLNYVSADSTNVQTIISAFNA